MVRNVESLEDEIPITPYWDPKLRHNQKVYHRLVQRLHDIGYFFYTTRPESYVGVFFVWKSSRTKLRMITDARLSNARFRTAPGVTLMTSESFGRFEFVVDSEVLNDHIANEAIQIVLGLSDVKDCFHRLRVPPWISRYFAWQAVPAKVVAWTLYILARGRCVKGGLGLYISLNDATNS